MSLRELKENLVSSCGAKEKKGNLVVGGMSEPLALLWVTRKDEVCCQQTQSLWSSSVPIVAICCN